MWSRRHVVLPRSGVPHDPPATPLRPHGPGPHLAGRVPAGRPPQRDDRQHRPWPPDAPNARTSRTSSRPGAPRAVAPHRRTQVPARPARPPAGPPPLRHNRGHADLCGAGRAGAEHRLPRRALRRRNPADRVDQRPRRRASTVPPSCCATGSAPARGPGRPSSAPTAASASSRGTTAAPAAPTGPTDPAHCGIEAFVEDALSVMDHFGIDQAPAHGLVDGRQHHVRAGLPAPRAGHRAVRGGRRPR